MDKYGKYVHSVDTGFVVAHFEEFHNQWRTSDVPPEYHGMGNAYRFSYANSLDRLVGMGARVYASRDEAIRVAEESYFIP